MTSRVARPSRASWTRNAPFDRHLSDWSHSRVRDVSPAYYVEYWSPLRSETYVRWFGSRVQWLRFAAQERAKGLLAGHGVMRPRQTPA
jgi:hypothetical protein